MGATETIFSFRFNKLALSVIDLEPALHGTPRSCHLGMDIGDIEPVVSHGAASRGAVRTLAVAGSVTTISCILSGFLRTDERFLATPFASGLV